MSFIRNYLEFATGNEAPELFHVFCGISTLASIVSRKIWIDQGYYTYYPNLYIVLVDQPGGGKSTALDIAKGFVRRYKIPMSADVTTVQGLMREMSRDDSPCKKTFKVEGNIIEYTPISIFAGELISFIGMDPYGWVNFLTTIYHEDVHEVKTKNKGDDLIKGPFINLLGALTTETTSNMLHQKIITSGFARRCIFIWGTGRGKPVPWPVITPAQKRAKELCDERAKILMAPKFHGQMTWDEEAKEWYGDWYTNLRNKIHAISTPTTVGYYESKHVQLQKIGMLFSVSESDDFVLRLGHLQAALHCLEQAEVNLPKVFDGAGRNVQSGIAAKLIQTVVNAREPQKLKRIQSVMYNDCDRQELDAILHHLQDIGEIKVFEHTLGGVSYGMYVATPKMFEEFKARTHSKVIDQASPKPSPEPPHELKIDL